MTLQHDASEKVPADRVDGLLTRREVLRRLALVGVTATPAGVLAACSGGRSWPTRRHRRRR